MNENFQLVFSFLQGDHDVESSSSFSLFFLRKSNKSNIHKIDQNLTTWEMSTCPGRPLIIRLVYKSNAAHCLYILVHLVEGENSRDDFMKHEKFAWVFMSFELWVFFLRNLNWEWKECWGRAMTSIASLIFFSREIHFQRLFVKRLKASRIILDIGMSCWMSALTMP